MLWGRHSAIVRFSPVCYCGAAGCWLQEAGIHAGVPVKVLVSRGQLVIEPDHDRAPKEEVLARIAQVTEGGLSKRDLNALIRRLKRDRID